MNNMLVEVLTLVGIGFLCGIMFMLLLAFNMTKKSYKQGQIDAINNKICYELILKEDGSTSWEKIEERKGGD